MDINWDLVLCLYGLGAAIAFIAYIVYLHKSETEFSLNSLQLFGMLILIILFWWVEVFCQIGAFCFKWLSKPIIKKRKAT
jgi:apolipoprotein N-acyltransferase